MTQLLMMTAKSEHSAICTKTIVAEKDNTTVASETLAIESQALVVAIMTGVVVVVAQVLPVVPKRVAAQEIQDSFRDTTNT